MKLADIRKKTPAQLNKQIEKLQEEIADLYRDGRNSKEKNVRSKLNKRREIARLKTVMREFELDKSSVEEDK